MKLITKAAIIGIAMTFIQAGVYAADFNTESGNYPMMLAADEPKTVCTFGRHYTKAFERKNFIWELDRRYCQTENKTSFTRSSCKSLKPCLEWIENNCGGGPGTCSEGEYTEEEKELMSLFPEIFDPESFD